MSISRFIVVAFIMLGLSQAKAQQSVIYKNGINEYRLGLELFDKEKYGAAQRQFDKAVIFEANPNSEISVNASYYAALCALELFNKDAEYQFTQFIQDHPESPHVKKAHFQLGRYSFRKKKWQKTINWFTKVDIYELTNEQLGEYYFKLGYAHFRMGDNSSALKALYEIKDVDTRYTGAARYYYGHINYNEGQYQTALEMFRKLTTDSKFSRIVPYYITQIYHLQGKYDELLTYAPALLDSAIPKRAPEISRLIGEAYYNKAQYEEAIPYLERYKQQANTNREDDYQLGFAYYKAGKLDKAINFFQHLTRIKDVIAQSCFYHLGDCYLQQQEKTHARSAFKEASKLTYDPKLKEDALFNYAKLCYELADDPFSRAIDTFTEFIETYPESDRKDEAYAYLVNVYMSTRNYQMALNSLDKIQTLDNKLKTAYQNLAYNRAVELYSNRQYQQAIKEFAASRKYKMDQKLATLSHYWAGEAYYKQKNYKRAIESYSTFIYSPGAILQKEFESASYNIGYAHFQLEQYADAALWLRKYADSKDLQDKKKQNDAYLRIADAYFVKADYHNADGYYDKAIKSGKLQADYAMFQRAVALGMLKKKSEKLALLKNLLSDHGNSTYADDAKFQLGKGYMLTDPKRATAYFDAITQQHPTSNYVNEALLNKGIIHRNNGENDKALAIFRQIAEDYRSYDDSKQAIAYARNIYVETGKVDNFKTWIATLEYYDVTIASLDSASYDAAYHMYTKGNYKKAAATFEKYLAEYEQPAYELKAQFYKADCNYRNKNYAEALGGFNYVIDHSNNKFMESSSLYASRINYHYEQFNDALSNYILLEKLAQVQPNRLEAWIGQMRCFAKIGNHDAAIQYCNKVLAADKVENDIRIEAHFTIANSSLASGNLDMAMLQFRKTDELTNSSLGAESKYAIARIYFSREQYDEAGKEIFELVRRKPAYQHWIAKSMILLADIYLKKGDNYEAKTTLQGVIDNYHSKDGLKEEAIKKLNEIIASDEEVKQQQEQEKEEIFEVVFDAEHFDVDSLFGEDTVKEEPLKVQVIDYE